MVMFLRSRTAALLSSGWRTPIVIRRGTFDFFALLRFLIELSGHVAQFFRRTKLRHVSGPKAALRCERNESLTQYAHTLSTSRSSPCSPTSALSPKADKQEKARLVRFVPLATERTAAKLGLHHLVGGQLRRPAIFG